MIDNEHSANDARTLRSMLRAAAHTQAVVLGRPLRFDPDEIRRYLDLGAEGILCPFINTGKERGVLWKPCRYPPQGIRGYGPRRAGVYGFDADEYFHQANEALPCITIIESEQGVQNIEEIVSVDGIDGVTIGPMDLSISLNIFKQFEHPAYQAAVERVRAACTKYGKAIGYGVLQP